MLIVKMTDYKDKLLIIAVKYLIYNKHLKITIDSYCAWFQITNKGNYSIDNLKYESYPSWEVRLQCRFSNEAWIENLHNKVGNWTGNWFIL